MSSHVGSKLCQPMLAGKARALLNFLACVRFASASPANSRLCRADFMLQALNLLIVQGVYERNYPPTAGEYG